MGTPDFYYGIDVNLSPLHRAVLQGNVDMAHDLIEHGADLNVQDLIAQETPLFYAIKSDNIELICMLLCYGADVTIKNKQSQMPIACALVYRRWDIVSILIDYYDDFNDGDKEGYVPLHMAIYYSSDLAVQLIDRGADVNYVTNEGDFMLELAMRRHPKLFKKCWGKINVDILLETKIPVFITYFEKAGHYNTKEWVECLHLLLESSIAADLIDECQVYCTSMYWEKGFITELLYTLHRKEVPSGDRQNIISICLSLGAEVTGTDLGAAMELFGFEGELEMLIYGTECYQNNEVHHPLLPLVIGSSDMKLPNIILWYKSYIKYEHPCIVPCMTELSSRVMVSCMGFVSLIPFWKLELLRVCPPSRLAWEFPSLLELSRNRVHSLVREGRKPQKPYQFFDAMKSLPLPGAVVDILLFKRPIYG